jgi:hypothetical protein
MEYCRQNRQSPPSIPGKSFFFGQHTLPDVTGAKAFLRYLAMPEDSTNGQPVQRIARPAWMGAAKAGFWTIISVIIGCLLAWLCK